MSAEAGRGSLSRGKLGGRRSEGLSLRVLTLDVVGQDDGEVQQGQEEADSSGDQPGTGAAKAGEEHPWLLSAPSPRGRR
jgi:hypothetical protein